MNAPMGMDKYKLSEEELTRLMMQMGMAPSTGRSGVRFGHRPMGNGPLPPSARLRIGPAGGGGGSVRLPGQRSNPQPTHTVKWPYGGEGTVQAHDMVVDPATGLLISGPEFQKKYGKYVYPG